MTTPMDPRPDGGDSAPSAEHPTLPPQPPQQPPAGAAPTAGGGSRARWIVPVVAVLVLGAVIAGVLVRRSHDSSGTKAADWASDVCDAIGKWSSDIDQQGKSFSPGGDNATITTVRDSLVQFLGGLGARTDDLVKTLDDEGEPDVTNGTEIQTDLVDAFRGISKSYAELKGRAEGLPVDSPQNFGQAAADLSQAADAAGTQAKQSVGDAFSKHPSRELDSAVNDEPACKNLKRS